MPKRPWTPYVITRNSWSFASAPKNAVHFLYGAALHLPALLPPLQSVFAKDTAFLSAKAQKRKNSAKQNSWIVCRFPPWNVFPPLKPAFWGFLGAKAGHSDRAVRRVEESWFGFLIAGGLCSKPGRSLCERIKLTFATAPGCLHSLSLGRHDRFCRLCNQFLPKTLRLSLQRHKSCKKRSFLRLSAGFRLGVFSRLCEPAGCVRIWLVAFGKAGLFRCQSRIRGLGLTAFDKKRLF